MALSFPHLDELRRTRTSIKWTRFDADVLPLFVAEMDAEVAPVIRDSVIERVAASDTGYLDAPGPLAPAFARFAAERWGWHLDPERVRIATDVSVGIVEAFRLTVRPGERAVVTPPVYPPFFELVEEAGAVVESVPLVHDDAPDAEGPGSWRLDLDGLERAFAGGARAFLLCSPHNPLGLVHPREELEALARLAARYDVFVVSDEVHAPLTHPGAEFVPFAPLAEAAGARAAVVTSASKAWNVAGLKCSLLVAADAATHVLFDGLWEEVACRVSIIGLHANLAAFERGMPWLDELVDHVVANDALLATLLAERLPGVVHHRPRAGYLTWLDVSALGLGDDPARTLRDEARVAFNAGHTFGDEGRGFVRLNLACAPETLVEAVDRVAAFVGARV